MAETRSRSPDMEVTFLRTAVVFSLFLPSRFEVCLLPESVHIVNSKGQRVTGRCSSIVFSPSSFEASLFHQRLYIYRSQLMSGGRDEMAGNVRPVRRASEGGQGGGGGLVHEVSTTEKLSTLFVSLRGR